MEEADPDARFSLDTRRVKDEGCLKWWGNDLLTLEGWLFDANLPDHVLSAHRFISCFEQFPKSPKEAIRMVREEKVYGDNWLDRSIDHVIEQLR